MKKLSIKTLDISIIYCPISPPSLIRDRLYLIFLSSGSTSEPGSTTTTAKPTAGPTTTASWTDCSDFHVMFLGGFPQSVY